MPNPGFIRGTHHLTFCVGGAQEDYDFHVRLLGLKSVKKTVLFDGEIPIYHLYYGNRVGDASTLLTAFPVPPGRMDGQAWDQPAEDAAAVSPGGLDRVLGRSPRRGRRRVSSARSCSAPSGWTSSIRAGSTTRSSATRSPIRASPTTAVVSAPSTRSEARTARRPRCVNPSRRRSSSPRGSTGSCCTPTISTTSSRSATRRATAECSS